MLTVAHRRLGEEYACLLLLIDALVKSMRAYCCL